LDITGSLLARPVNANQQDLEKYSIETSLDSLKFGEVEDLVNFLKKNKDLHEEVELIDAKKITIATRKLTDNSSAFWREKIRKRGKKVHTCKKSEDIFRKLFIPINVSSMAFSGLKEQPQESTSVRKYNAEFTRLELLCENQSEYTLVELYLSGRKSWPQK
jgi:hypothetical protein